MSRIRGIETKVQKEINSRRNEINENNRRRTEVAITEKRQIDELLHKLPKLGKIFDVHRKIGEGTFSSVYLGTVRAHAAAAAAGGERRWYALKHLVPTAHPARVEHELRCLRDMGGKNNVIGVELCLRHLDTIVFVMPYIPHRKFSEYVGEMDAAELREYMRALLVALRHVHSFGVIHRDVKPSNFLYDRDNKRYLLVDFGLAQRVIVAPPPAHAATAVKRPRDQDAEEGPPDPKRVALDLSVRVAAATGDPRVAPTPGNVAQSPVVSASPAAVAAAGAAVPGRCECAGVGGVCGPCGRRPAPRAPRAGTQGFRPPEVLLKYPYQTVAVDMWAAGVVLASVLCARYPLLRAAGDAHALAELADLLGTAPLARAARVLGRRLVTSCTRRPLCLRKLSARLRGLPPPALPPAPAPAAPPAGPPAAPAPPPRAGCSRCRLPTAQCLCRADDAPASCILAGVMVAGFPDAAFALAARLLEPDPRRRISAQAALEHPFLQD